MNQHFNLTRFGRLLRKHTAEHLTSYLIGAAVLLGGLVVVLGGGTYITRRPLQLEGQAIIFTFILLGAGVAFTATVFSSLAQPREAAFALLLPASHLEKYLVAWLYSLPVFLVVYTAVFSAVNAVMLHLGDRGQGYQMLNFMRTPQEVLMPLLSYVLLHSLALWAALYFRRLQLIKTGFLVFGLLAALLLINSGIMHLLLPGSHVNMPLDDVWVDKNSFSVALPAATQHLVVLALPVALALLLWAAAYARLTEKQL